MESESINLGRGRRELELLVSDRQRAAPPLLSVPAFNTGVPVEPC